MSKPFLIRHPDGREYELADVDYFVATYQPEGFRIVDPAPNGYAVPEVPKPATKKSAPAPAKADD